MAKTALEGVRLNEPLGPLILTVRGQRVMLDADLARLYGVPTMRLNEAVKRNRMRFPADFALQLTAGEFAILKSQSAISSAQPTDAQAVTGLQSQPATSSLPLAQGQEDAPNRAHFAAGSHGGRRKLPWAFTEHGALMAANTLRSGRAIHMSIYVIRAFVRMREQIAANAAILKRLAEIDKTLLEHDGALRVLWSRLQPLLQPPPEPPRRRIGFQPPEQR